MLNLHPICLNRPLVKGAVIVAGSFLGVLVQAMHSHRLMMVDYGNATVAALVVLRAFLDDPGAKAGTTIADTPTPVQPQQP